MKSPTITKITEIAEMRIRLTEIAEPEQDVSLRRFRDSQSNIKRRKEG